MLLSASPLLSLDKVCVGHWAKPQLNAGVLPAERDLRMKRRTFLTHAATGATAVLVSSPAFAQATPNAATPVSSTLVESGYAPVNGLEMYYEIHGQGAPLVMLHGGMANIEWPGGPLMRELAITRQVIAIEFQAHGHTADIDRPMTYENLRDDIAAFITWLDLGPVDVLGFSVGGVVTLGVGISNPELVRKLVVVSASISPDLQREENIQGTASMSAEALAGSPIEQSYMAIAPNPEDFPTLIAKVQEMSATFQGWAPEDVRAIAAPTLIVVGDADAIQLDATLELLRLRGGDVNGDFVGVPESQLAIIPGATHFSILTRLDVLLTIIPPFLDAPAAA
jgi:pimeloyl-ACP methyl ester carboxylesterase